jgi:hypothetical protein
MTNRNFKLAAVALSAFFGSLTPLLAQQATPEQQTAPAQQAGAASTDACLPTPKGAAPQGKHWYYHTDRSAGRKCWYLGEAGLKTVTSRTAQPKASSAADSTPASQQNLDARAEAPSQPVAKPSNVKSSTAPATDTTTETSEPATTQATSDGVASAPLLTQRWPEADAFRPSQTTGAATPLANSQPANLQPAPSQAAAPASAAPPSPSAQPAAATPAPAPSSAPSDQPASLSSWRTILGALLVALGFAGLLGFITFRYFGRTDIISRNTPKPRRNIWGDKDEEAASPSPSYDQMIAPSRWASAARASLAPQDLDEIEQLLRRAALEPHPAANTNSLADPAARARTPTAPSAARASTAQRAGSFRPR